MEKNCKHCGKGFTVFPEDIKFYESISPTFNNEQFTIPAPTLCPECRRQRRMSFRNERSLYKRKCDLTGREIISVYSNDKPFKVFQHKEWESDAWDPMDYGREYDPTRSFFEQFSELQKLVPKKALHIPDNMINCDFCNYGGNSKDCYLCFAPWESQNCLYSRVAFASQLDVDGEANLMCSYTYQCISCVNCYESFYCQFCENCQNSSFLIDCSSCKNCFGCIGQKHKEYMFLNEQLNKEEYEEKTRGILASAEKLAEFKEKFEEIKAKAIYKYARNTNTENCTGDILRNCKNCFDSYDLFDQQDSRYCELGGAQTTNVHDSTIAGLNMVNGYEQIGSASCHDSAFMVYVTADQDCYYCISCRNCKNCFGCEGLKYKEYCILNKQYSKDEYEELMTVIIKNMIESGEWGEFFPTAISPYAYNESLAYTYFPCTKEEAENEGWQWKEIEDNVRSISESEDLKICLECNKHFKLIKQEKDFYQKYSISTPQKCPNCRYIERVQSMPLMQFWNRQCMNADCQNTFQTSYAPERLETVYCEKCYLEAVY